MTLSDYVGKFVEQRVLVEHGRCGRPLGEHLVFGDDYGLIIRKHLGAPRHTDDVRVLMPHARGPETTPGINCAERLSGDEPYARAYCVCLPDGHVEKRRLSKLGELPVTFPDWKWGRSVDLPVVTF